jgi:hypothetical protein
VETTARIARSTSGTISEGSPGALGVGAGDARATALGLGVAVADAAVVEEGDAGGGDDAVPALGLAPPAAPPTLGGEHAMTALAAKSPLASTVVEKQYELRATSIVASSAGGIRSS